ncbi:hypothetical protein HDU97_007910 [Phlyctochytrium planicorne]|nr:hypothetical protein HDU97_007910 [Phlyctochytrium planicorne]
MATIKIGTLLIRTLAKPIANSIKNQAKNHPRFKRFCINVAQTYHSIEETLKMRFFDYKITAIRPLNEAKAVELGASFISESLLFGVAGFTIVFEAWRSSRKASSRVLSVDESIARLEAERLMDVESLVVLSEEVKALRLQNESLIRALGSVSLILLEQQKERRASGWFSRSPSPSPSSSPSPSTSSSLTSQTANIPPSSGILFDELQLALQESENFSRNIQALEQKVDARPPASVAANVVEAGLVEPR